MNSLLFFVVLQSVSADLCSPSLTPAHGSCFVFVSQDVSDDLGSSLLGPAHQPSSFNSMCVNTRLILSCIIQHFGHSYDYCIRLLTANVRLGPFVLLSLRRI